MVAHNIDPVTIIIRCAPLTLHWDTCYFYLLSIILFIYYLYSAIGVLQVQIYRFTTDRDCNIKL